MNKDIYIEWENIEKHISENYLKEYIVSKTCPNKFYIGVNNFNRVIFIEFNNYIINKIKNKSIEGFNIREQRIPDIDPKKVFLIIEDNSNSPEIFEAFSSTLSSNLENVKDESNTVESIIKSIEEYQNYFKDTNSSLTKIEEQGLFGELLELRELISEKGENSILAWTGPNKNKRDFVFENNNAIEIKTTTSQINPYISISNELQLDNHYPSDLNKLYLKVFILEEIDTGETVLDIANIIFNELKSDELKKIYLAKLIQDKINLKTFLPKYKFKIQSISKYRINDSFPKITRNNLDKGIFEVKYKLELEDIKNFIVEEKEYE